MMKKILIFGATGNTGKYLVDYFINNKNKSKCEVIAIGRKTTKFFLKNNIKYINLDILNSDDYKRLPQKNVLAVLHTAAKLPTHSEKNNPYDFIFGNVIGTLNILEYCKQANVDRIIFTQTMSSIANELGKIPVIKPNIPRSFPFKGDHVLYVLSKNMAEDLVKHYNQQYGIKSFIFKIPTIYQYRENRYWYVNGIKKFRTFQYFIDLAIAGKSIEMWGEPNSYKDLVYVKDYCQMLYKATFIDNIKNGIYNVGTGIPTKLIDMLNEIVRVFSPDNNKSKIIHKPEKPNTPSYIIDICNAKKELGYEPQFDLKKMLIDIKKEMELNRFLSL